MKNKDITIEDFKLRALKLAEKLTGIPASLYSNSFVTERVAQRLMKTDVRRDLYEFYADISNIWRD